MRRKIFFVIPALVAAAVVAVLVISAKTPAGAAPVTVPENALYCGTCHSMDKEVQTWQESAHVSIACLECHEETVSADLRVDWGDHLKKMVEYTPKANLKALPLVAPDKRCQDCHQPQMTALLKETVPAPVKGGNAPNQGQPLPVKAAHDLHLNGQAKLECAACHFDSAHGPKAGSTERKESMHKRCMECHTEKQVVLETKGSTSCGACHNDPKSVLPNDHKDQNLWITGHGDATKSQNCAECHLDKSAGTTPGKMASPAAFKTTVGDTCATCHAGVPMPHPATYLTLHGKASQMAQAGTCETCHSPAKNKVQPAPAYVSERFCYDCHAGQSMPHPASFLPQHGQASVSASSGACAACHSGRNPAAPASAHAAIGFCTSCHAGQPMPHGPLYLAKHGADATANPQTCQACHSPKNPVNPKSSHSAAAFCISCHDSFQHPAGWVAAHGSKVDQTCATCHTLLGKPGNRNACATCHKPDGQWHPDLFWVSHAREVEQKGDEACMTCHKEVQPSCTKCHRD